MAGYAWRVGRRGRVFVAWVATIWLMTEQDEDADEVIQA